jgi:hypothetical protein
MKMASNGRRGFAMDFNHLAKLSRFKDIITTLLKYGLDEAVQRLNFPGAKLIKRIHPVKREIGIYEFMNVFDAF